MRKKVVFAMALMMVCASLTGCEDAEVTQLKQIEALNAESTIVDSGMSANEREAQIYAQVSNRTLLDLTKLDVPSDNEKQEVTAFMDAVNQQLIGEVAGEDGVLNVKYIEYLLMMFEQTPYYWQRSSMNIRGIDSETRNVIVDVTYKTTGYTKDVIMNTLIPKGLKQLKADENGSITKGALYDALYDLRAQDYRNYYEIKYQDLRWNDDSATADTTVYENKGDYPAAGYVKYRGVEVPYGVPKNIDQDSEDFKRLIQAREKFYYTYGAYPDKIKKDDVMVVEDQLGGTLEEYVENNGNQVTFGGLLDNADYESIGGTMTVRYILTPQYTLGINQGYKCDHMYVLDYELDNDPTENLETYNAEGTSTIADNVYDLIYRYFTCEDESNHLGLYKLSTNYAGLDKYFDTYFNTTYRKHDNFTISIFNVSGQRVECGITVSVKERAKGSNMTLPIYTNRYYACIDLGADTTATTDTSILKVTDLVLLSSKIEGEPAITAEDAETTGFNASITLENKDKSEIEQLISDYGVLQLAGDSMSDKFSEVVDGSISGRQMATLKDNFDKIKGKKKAVWLTGYQQGTSNYASVKCKALVDTESGLTQATETYDFIYKGGKWYISGYTLDTPVVLDSADFASTGALCVCTPEKVEEYHSQVTLDKDKEGKVDLDTIGEITNYEESAPPMKNGDGAKSPEGIGE